MELNETRRDFLSKSRGAAMTTLRAAGKVELERAEKPATVKRYLSEAAHEIGVRVRSSWEDPKQPRVLLWKKTKR